MNLRSLDRQRRRRARRQSLARKRFSFLESLEARTLLAGDPILDNQPIAISEFSADNDLTLSTRTRATNDVAFEGGETRPDWIELMNLSDQPLDLGGMHLTDDVNAPNKWTFPSGTQIAPGEFLVVYASGEDITDASLDENGALHTNFRLSDAGEYLGLTDTTGNVIHEFSPSYPVVRVDQSVGLRMDVRSLVGPNAPLEYHAPIDDALAATWQLAEYQGPAFVTGASPVGYDRGGGPVEVAESIGAELFKRGSADFSSGSLVVFQSDPFTQVGRVVEWSFYSETSRTITPLIFKAVGDEFEIVGVGAPRTSDGSGSQTFAFELQSGTADVEASGFFFGTKDGDNQVDEQGVVRFDRTRDGTTVRRYNGPLSGHLVVGEALTGGRDVSREYSVQATTHARLAGPINTDVNAEVGAATSLFVRYPFVAEQIETLRSLSLDVRYDDGFVAYLNGQEIARRNAPNDVAFDSAASDQQTTGLANRLERINVSQFRSALMEGANVLAIHGLNSADDPTQFLIDARLSGVDITSADLGLAADPTPHEINGVMFDGFVPTVDFSHTRGFYDQAVQLRLSTPGVPEAEIYYTLDGTDPAPENPSARRYEQPIDVLETTTLRATGFAERRLPSQPMTQTYIFPADVAMQETLAPEVMEDPVWGPQFTSSLLAIPTMSIVTESELNITDEFPTSIEWINADGTEGFQVDAGVEVFGGQAISFPKRSMRFSFKNEYGPETLEYDLFDDPNGVAQFDQFLLRSGSHDTPFGVNYGGDGTYIRNRWAQDVQLEMGHLAPRGRFVNVFLNGEYWGFYHLTERPNAAFMASHLGGDPDEYDALNAGSPIDGDLEAWHRLLDSIGGSWDVVESQLDVVNYADYVLLQWYGGNNIDWRAESNWMAARRRSADGKFQFFSWDSDVLIRTGADVDVVYLGGPGFLWTRNGGLQQYPEFRQLLSQRAQLHFYGDGALSDEAVRSNLDALAEQLRPVIVAETARWGSGGYTPQTWEDGVQWIKDTYAPLEGDSRIEIVIQQMRHAGVYPLSDPPSFLADGQPLSGDVLSAGSQLSMTAPAGTIYYTLDGSDPQANFPKLSYTELIGETSQVRVHVPTDDSLERNWTGVDFDDSDWMAGQNGVGYDSSETQEIAPLLGFDIQTQLQDVNASAYIRVPFQVDEITMDSLEFSIRYDDAYVAYLNGVEVARREAPVELKWNSQAQRGHDFIEGSQFEPINLTPHLDLLRAGENVLAIHGLNAAAINDDFLITPRLLAGVVTDAGVAAQANAYSGPIDVPPESVIRARTLLGDQWSALREAATPVEVFPLRVSEVMYHPVAPTEAEQQAGIVDADEFEFIEFVNLSDGTLDLSQVKLEQRTIDGEEEGVAFDFSSGQISQLPPGGRLLVVENLAAFRVRYGDDLPVAGQWAGGLRNSSEQITVTVNGQTLQQFAYDDAWHPATDGNGASLEAVDAANPDFSVWGRPEGWRASEQINGTPGTSPVTRVLGDSNGDGHFNHEDLSFVHAAGKYDTGLPATFAEGDWNGDGVFDSGDFRAALVAGTFESERIVHPQGRDDVYEVDEEQRLVVDATDGVLANDIAPNGTTLVAELIVQPANGMLQLQSDGSFTYVPAPNFFGIDTFQYVPVSGSQEGSATTVTLDVRPINDPPIGRGELHMTRPNERFAVPASEGVLANDVDPDHSFLSARLENGPIHGTLELASDGSFRYTPNAEFQGIDRFTYRASDGEAESEPTTVSLSVNPQHVIVSEFAASVQNSYRDYDDDSSDWIELTNLDSDSVDLQGWYLTDNADNLTRWRIPNETILTPGESVIVVASGKNVVAPTGEMHTNFRLDREGEYLALVGPNGTSIVWDSFPTYPELFEDVTYGTAVTTTTKLLLNAGSDARHHVPTSDQLGQQWTTPAYDDTNWTPASASVGYATELPGQEVPGFSARMLKVDGGLVWQLETTRAAESLFDGTADPHDYFVVEDVETVVPEINFGGIQSVTPAGDFPDAIPYPDGTTFNTLDDFAIQVKANVFIPAGQWTIGFGSSDGGVLRLEGIEFLETSGEEGETEIRDGDGEIIHNGMRRSGWTTGKFEVAEGGIQTTLEAVYFERRAADYFEIVITPEETNTTPNRFRGGWTLLSDETYGWRVNTIDLPRVPEFDSTIRTDLETELSGRSASVYTRIPFTVDDAADLEQLQLRIRYDDGFVAYLNGTEVARDNVTGDVNALSRADVDRPDSEANEPAVFDISQHVGLLTDGVNVLALHGLNADIAASGMLLVPELVGVDLHPANPAYMRPSPAEANSTGGISFLEPPVFSVDSQSFSDPFTLEIHSNHPQASVRYTLDGSIPDETSMLYTDPLAIVVSSQVRARSFLADHLASHTATEQFIRLSDDLVGFNSNLPLLVVDTFGQTVPPTNSRLFINAAAAVFDTEESGRAELGSQPELISRIGLRERGSSSAGQLKKPYRIEFRQDHNDEDRNVDLLGLSRESDFILVPGYLFDRSMNRNTVIYDLSNQIGAYASETRYVEVFMNPGRGQVSSEHYMGVYPLIETVKVGENRLDIGQLSPQYTTEPLVSGGYVFKFDRPAPGETGFTLAPDFNVQMVEPNEEVLNQNPAQLEYLRNYVTDLVTALKSPDFTHPDTGQHYSHWVDVDAVIDHYILYEIWQATDALFFSGHWYKPRDGKLQPGPIWDFDRSAGSTDGRNNDPRGWFAINSAPAIWHDFFVDPEFRQAFIDRWSELQSDVLSWNNIAETYDRITDPIAEAQVRNFQQWTDVPPRSDGGIYGVLDGTWEGEVLHMKLYLQDRQHWMRGLFLQTPEFTVSHEGATADSPVFVTLRGDLNRDGQANAADMVLLSEEVGAGTHRNEFDLTADALVDQMDLQMMAQLLDTIAGDVDLDGDVDEVDEAIYLDHLGQPTGGTRPTWLDADFDGNGQVDEDDGAFINENLGFDRVESLPTGTMIYYTTDGSDPRLPGGGISPAAIRFDGSIQVTKATTLNARSYDPDFNVSVRGFQQEDADLEPWSGLATIRVE